MKMRKRNVKVSVAVFATVVVLSLAVFADDLGLYGPPTTFESAAVGAAALEGDTRAFIQFDGIDGESEDRPRWSDVLSFDQGQSVPGTTTTPSAGACRFDDLILTKEVDKASPQLAEAVCMGRIFPTVTIEVTSAAFGGQVYYAYELTDVFVAGYRIVSSPVGARPTEELALRFRRIRAVYVSGDGETLDYTADVR